MSGFTVPRLQHLPRQAGIIIWKRYMYDDVLRLRILQVPADMNNCLQGSSGQRRPCECCKQRHGPDRLCLLLPRDVVAPVILASARSAATEQEAFRLPTRRGELHMYHGPAIPGATSNPRISNRNNCMCLLHHSKCPAGTLLMIAAKTLLYKEITWPQSWCIVRAADQMLRSENSC